MQREIVGVIYLQLQGTDIEVLQQDAMDGFSGSCIFSCS